jgi:hypothetical protein
MSHPITTLADLKIGSDHFVIELIEDPNTHGTVTITWPQQPVSVSARRFPEIAAQLTRVIASASMELSRTRAGGR